MLASAQTKSSKTEKKKKTRVSAEKNKIKRKQNEFRKINLFIYIIKFVIYIFNLIKRIMEPTMDELINKTQVSPKIIPTSSCRLGGSTL